MKRLLLITVLTCLPLSAQKPVSHPLTSTRSLKLVGVKAEPVTFKGKKALRVGAASGDPRADGVALLEIVDFKNGVIEIDLAGGLAANAAPDARGFVGVVFHSDADGSKYESFYLRPTNGRADDQLRRNHSTQYVSEPEYPWHRLRKENPGVYESYVDLEADVWTRMRIEVDGVKARLYINGASQPALIVNDLKLGETGGHVGLWSGPGTVAHFANLKITPKNAK
jgi:hypothetical protein